MKKYFTGIITHPLFSGSAVMVIGSNSVSFLNYLYHFVMGRMLGPASYGELAAIISLAGLLGMIPASLNLVVIKHISAAKSEEEVITLASFLKTKIFFVSLILFIFIFILSPLVSSFLNLSKVSYLVLVSISFLFSLQALLNRSILQGLLKFKEMVISMLVENGIKLLTGIFLVYLGFQVGGAVTGLVIATILGWYISNLYLRFNIKRNPQIQINLKGMLLFTIPVLIQSISSTSIYSSDVILVKHFFSPHDAGIYAALSTLGKIIFFGAGPIGAVMFPLVSQREAKGEPHQRIFLYSFLATVLLSLGVLVIFYLLPELSIKSLFGSAYLEASSLLIWFGFFITLFTLSSLLVNYNLSLGKTKVVYLALLAAFLQIIMILFIHQTLYEVILISIIISALLLLFLLIYSTYGKWIFIRK